MALTDLIRKKSTSHNASAIHAIPATREGRGSSKIAKIASIAIAKPDVAKDCILEKLRLFRFDLVARDIEDGYPAVSPERVNNMAWEFMQVDGMAFSAALHLAAQIVTECNVAASESAYEDVRALWRRLTRNLD